MSAKGAARTGGWLDGPCPSCMTLWRTPAAAANLPACSDCARAASPLHLEHLDADGSLWGCLACGHDQLYWARDFPKALGVGVVVAAAVLAPFTMYLSLAAGALLDAALVVVVPKRLHCYRCGAMHHRFPGAGHWRPFQLEVADVHAYGDKAAVVKTLGESHAPPDGRRPRRTTRAGSAS